MNRKIAVAALGSGLLAGTAGVRAADVPRYDHVVIVMDENKDYSQIVGAPDAPYITQLAREGANFTQFYAEEHHSEGNYLWLFSGDRQTVDFQDGTPPEQFTTPNLGASLMARGFTFRGYAEDLPEVGSLAAIARPYARKHNPYVNWETPAGQTAGANQYPLWVNQPFTSFPGDPANLPTVCWIVPNLNDDMHDGTVKMGDVWLKKNLGAFAQWAPAHNSLLILTWDESSQKTPGPTDPANPQNSNRIATIFYGADIKPGDYPEGKGVTHVNVLRTLEAMYGLPKEGAQAPNATAAGISDGPITDCFTSSSEASAK